MKRTPRKTILQLGLSKRLLLCLISLLSFTICHADFMDEVSIKFKGEEVFNTSKTQNVSLLELDDCRVGDTISVELRTDWGGEFNSILEVIDEQYQPPLVKMYKAMSESFAGIYHIILSGDMLNQALKLRINYHVDSLQNWNFVTLLAKSSN